jgi:hypothetical protein
LRRRTAQIRQAAKLPHPASDEPLVEIWKLGYVVDRFGVDARRDPGRLMAYDPDAASPGHSRRA